MVVFYGLNDMDLDAPDDDAYDMVVGIASGRIDHRRAAELLSRWHSPPEVQA